MERTVGVCVVRRCICVSSGWRHRYLQYLQRTVCRWELQNETLQSRSSVHGKASVHTRCCFCWIEGQKLFIFTLKYILHYHWPRHKKCRSVQHVWNVSWCCLIFRLTVGREQMAVSFLSPAQNVTGWTGSMWCLVSRNNPVLIWFHHWSHLTTCFHPVLVGKVVDGLLVMRKIEVSQVVREFNSFTVVSQWSCFWFMRLISVCIVILMFYLHFLHRMYQQDPTTSPSCPSSSLSVGKCDGGGGGVVVTVFWLSSSSGIKQIYIDLQNESPVKDKLINILFNWGHKHSFVHFVWQCFSFNHSWLLTLRSVFWPRYPK